MATDGGGWIVIQRNKKDSLVNFLIGTGLTMRKGFGMD